MRGNLRLAEEEKSRAENPTDGKGGGYRTLKGKGGECWSGGKETDLSPGGGRKPKDGGGEKWKTIKRGKEEQLVVLQAKKTRSITDLY